MLQLHQDMAHPGQVGGLARLGALDNCDGWLLVLVFLPPLLDGGYFMWDEIRNRFPVLLVCAGVEFLLAGYKNLQQTTGAISTKHRNRLANKHRALAAYI